MTFFSRKAQKEWLGIDDLDLDSEPTNKLYVIYTHSLFSWYFIGCFKNGILYRIEGNLEVEEILEPDMYKVFKKPKKR